MSAAQGKIRPNSINPTPTSRVVIVQKQLLMKMGVKADFLYFIVLNSCLLEVLAAFVPVQLLSRLVSLGPTGAGHWLPQVLLSSGIQ